MKSSNAVGLLSVSFVISIRKISVAIDVSVNYIALVVIGGIRVRTSFIRYRELSSLKRSCSSARMCW